MSHIQKLANKVQRLNYLKEHGFTEQNNIEAYRAKIAQSPSLQLICKIKRFSRMAAKINRNFRGKLDRVVGLA